MTGIDEPVDYWPTGYRPPRRRISAALLRRIDTACLFCAGFTTPLPFAIVLGRHVRIVTGGTHPVSFSPAAVVPEWLAWVTGSVAAGLLVLSFAVLEPAIRRARRREAETGVPS